MLTHQRSPHMNVYMNVRIYVCMQYDLCTYVLWMYNIIHFVCIQWMCVFIHMYRGEGGRHHLRAVHAWSRQPGWQEDNRFNECSIHGRWLRWEGGKIVYNTCLSYWFLTICELIKRKNYRLIQDTEISSGWVSARESSFKNKYTLRTENFDDLKNQKTC